MTNVNVSVSLTTELRLEQALSEAAKGNFFTFCAVIWHIKALPLQKNS